MEGLGNAKPLSAEHLEPGSCTCDKTVGFGDLGIRAWGLGFGVWGLGCRVWGLGFGVWGLGFRVWGLGFRVQVSRAGL